MSRTLEQLRQSRNDLWFREWSEGVGCCRGCDKDYTQKQTLVINGDNHCPHCKQEEDKHFYYCEQHGGITCKECEHNV